ncbi:hypothetical protein B0H19DRAFT_1237602 [Mycena capillaripes]|nr:hypothetical protein B0H19DRAFT_1237602 [Mycena capillaripes]
MSAVAYTLLATSPRPQSPSTPTQASMSDEQMDLVEILRSGEDSRLRRWRPERNDAAASAPVVLFCGSDKDSEVDWDEHRPWEIEIIPETRAPLPARKRQKRSSGCGARIHARAVPDRRWRALLDGASTDVVELEDKYFTGDMKRELLMGKERCGCRRSGVGCAICGNPLGALFTPCARHTPSSPATQFASSHYTFLRAAVSPPIPSTRRVSVPADEVLTARGEREALQRRIRDREELQQLRARMRAAQQPQTRPPPSRDPSDDLVTAANATTVSSLRGMDRERERRSQRMQQQQENAALHMGRLQAAGDHGRAAFAAWADATLQRATATAASDVPVVVDLSSLMDFRAPASPPEPAAAPAARELSEEERRRDWQRGVFSTASRTFGRDWPTMSQTVEGTTTTVAVPGPEPRTRGFTVDELQRDLMTRREVMAMRTAMALAEGTSDPVARWGTVEEVRRDVMSQSMELPPSRGPTLEAIRRGPVERVTAMPERRSLEEVLNLRRHTTSTSENTETVQETREEDREREEPRRRRIFFER